jgi:hypothetical protein
VRVVCVVVVVGTVGVVAAVRVCAMPVAFRRDELRGTSFIPHCGLCALQIPQKSRPSLVRHTSPARSSPSSTTNRPFGLH